MTLWYVLKSIGVRFIKFDLRSREETLPFPGIIAPRFRVVSVVLGVVHRYDYDYNAYAARQTPAFARITTSCMKYIIYYYHPRAETALNIHAIRGCTGVGAVSKILVGGPSKRCGGDTVTNGAVGRSTPCTRVCVAAG